MTTTMTRNALRKSVQDLEEAHGAERAWDQMLSQHVALTPGGSYRTFLERQQKRSRRNIERLRQRLGELGSSHGILELATAGMKAVGGLWDHAAALSLAPLNLVRAGVSGEEKMVSNAKDQASCLERLVFIYQSVEHLASAVEDDATSELASDVRLGHEQGLEELRGMLNGLVDAVVRAKIDGKPVYDMSRTAAAQTGRRVTDEVQAKIKDVGHGIRSEAHKVPGVTQLEGEIRGALAVEGDLPIGDYESLTAADVVSKLPLLSQLDLAKVDAYERKRANRSTVTDRIRSLQGDEPWVGYDEETVVDVRKKLAGGDNDLARTVQGYERRHKDRQGVLDAAESALAQRSD